MSCSAGNFGLNIAKRRTSLKMSQERLGQITGMSTKTIQRIETGSSAKTEKVPGLCDALNTTPNELFEYQEPDFAKMDFSGLVPELAQELKRTVEISGTASPEKQRMLAVMMKSLLDSFQAIDTTK